MYTFINTNTDAMQQPPPTEAVSEQDREGGHVVAALCEA